jgi:serine/threonine protein kinase
VNLPAHTVVYPGEWTYAELASHAVTDVPYLCNARKLPVEGIRTTWHPRIVQLKDLDFDVSKIVGNVPDCSEGTSGNVSPVLANLSCSADVKNENNGDDNGSSMLIDKEDEEDEKQKQSEEAEGKPDLYIAKLSKFTDPPSYLNETYIYQYLQGHDIAPDFLAHVAENDRVVGFLLHAIRSGREARLEDLGECQNVLRRLHGLGIAHGDVKPWNFVVVEDELKLEAEGRVKPEEVPQEGLNVDNVKREALKPEEDDVQGERGSRTSRKIKKKVWLVDFEFASRIGVSSGFDSAAALILKEDEMMELEMSLRAAEAVREEDGRRGELR